jgi:cation transport regulator ChaC
MQAPILQKEGDRLAELLYFAYGSNMNLDQMEFRCPAAEVVGNVRLEDYRLTFCSRNPDSGVATILPEQGSHVDGVLWKITPDCERSLDRYEGYPYLYGKEVIHVKTEDGTVYESMVYTMNAPHKDCPARPSRFYLQGILEGCVQNGIQTEPIKEAVKQTQKEVRARNAGTKKKDWER